MSRKIKCSNNSGMSITFGDEFSPYLLVDADGVYSVKNTISSSANTMIDGSTYQGSVTKARNIVLSLADKENHQTNRNQLYNLFKPKTKGTLTYSEDDETRVIDYYVESIDIDSINRVRTATISLICPDPFFTDVYDINLVMAGWLKNFEFQHEFSSEKEEFGVRSYEKNKKIENNSGADNIGLTFTISCNGSVTNPSLVHIEQNEFIKVGTDAMPFTMDVGDKLIITTGTGNKHVYYVHEGIQTEINEYLDEDSEFIQLQAGTNTIGYEAEDGENYVSVQITYRYKYLGV